MAANDRQHGGGHYKKLKIEHWDYVVANNIPYLEACAIKYLTRWRDKGGMEDLLKARHYVDKIIEVENANAAELLPKPSGEDSMPSAIDPDARNGSGSEST